MTYDPNRPTSYGATEREFDNAADKAQNAMDTVKEKAADVRDKAADVMSDVKDKAQQVSSTVATKADAATDTMGAKMTDVAQTIREKAPETGPVADVADKAAHTMEKAGTYLQDHDLASMRADLEGIIRRHPMEAMLIGLGVGYLLARSRR